MLDALWKAVCSGKFFVDGGEAGIGASIRLPTITGNGGPDYTFCPSFYGPTREDVIAKLIAFQVAERLA